MQKLEEMGQLRQELIERNEKIADLECQLEEKSLILNNSRKTLKQEREKLKVQYIKIDSQWYVANWISSYCTAFQQQNIVAIVPSNIQLHSE